MAEKQLASIIRRPWHRYSSAHSDDRRACSRVSTSCVSTRDVDMVNPRNTRNFIVHWVPVGSNMTPCVFHSIMNVQHIKVLQGTHNSNSDNSHLLFCTKTHCVTVIYTGGPQKLAAFLYALTLLNINQFSKLFLYQNQEKICNNNVTKDPTTPQVCRYTTLWNVKCLKRHNWKQDDFCSNIF